MAYTRQQVLVSAAALILIFVSVALTGWRFYDSMRGPKRVQIDSSYQVPANSPRGRRRKDQQSKYAVSNPSSRDVYEGR